jgi:hypothetical protein
MGNYYYLANHTTKRNHHRARREKALTQSLSKVSALIYLQRRVI